MVVARGGEAMWDRRLSVLARSGPARVVGTLIGLGAIGLLVVRILRDPTALTELFGRLSGPRGAWMAGGFLAFHALAIRLIAQFGAHAPSRVWAGGQVSKYLPVPGAALIGMSSVAASGGLRAREALGLTLRSTAALIAGASTVFTVLVLAVPLPLIDQGWARVIAASSGALMAGAGFWLALGGDRTAQRVMRIVLLGTGAWLALAMAIGLGLAVDPVRPSQLAAVYAAGWVVGQLVVPVPAGLGVREFAIVALLAGLVDVDTAVAYAVLSRLAHTLSDVLVAPLLWRPLRSLRP